MSPFIQSGTILTFARPGETTKPFFNLIFQSGEWKVVPAASCPDKDVAREAERLTKAVRKLDGGRS